MQIFLGKGTSNFLRFANFYHLVLYDVNAAEFLPQLTGVDVIKLFLEEI